MLFEVMTAAGLVIASIISGWTLMVYAAAILLALLIGVWWATRTPAPSGGEFGQESGPYVEGNAMQVQACISNPPLEKFLRCPQV